MKKIIFALAAIAAFTFDACGGGASEEGTTTDEAAKIDETAKKETQITGTYSGTDNVGMESTIILRSGGTLIIQSSIGDGTPDYGNWTGTAENLSLYHKDSYGRDELIGNAKVTDLGLKIIGGKLYFRQ